MCPFIIYADTEALCQKQLTSKLDPIKAGTIQLEKQEACSFGAVLVDRTTKQTKYEFEQGPDCIPKFSDWLRLRAKILSQTKQTQTTPNCN